MIGPVDNKRPWLSHAGAQVLIVDDEPLVRTVVSRELGGEGYTCSQAQSAEEALVCLAEASYDLIVTDVMMPGMSGVELLEKARQIDPSIAVVICTAVNDRRVAVEALQKGAFGYVMKPFDADELLINVTNALERRRLETQSRKYQQMLEEEVRERSDDVRRREAEIVLRLMSASEFRDDETGAHIRRIGLYAASLAEAMGWSGQKLDDILLAGPMHDIGKIGVPDGILLKPGKLVEKEFDAVKEHCRIGARILGSSQIPLLNVARDIAFSHHERWDGSGYPRGLKGEEIPQCARIVALCDVYDALVTDRVYRPAMSHEQAVEIMNKERGRQFDPALFDCFMERVPEFRRIHGIVSTEDFESLHETLAQHLA